MDITYALSSLKYTQDGFIARQNGESKWISNLFSRKLVHKWRSEEKGILVGVNTANIDNPKLNVRHWAGKNPVRIILDPHNKLIKNQKADRQKTGLILAQGLVLIRIKQEKKISQRYLRQISQKLMPLINSIQKKYPQKDERYFEL